LRSKSGIKFWAMRNKDQNLEKEVALVHQPKLIQSIRGAPTDQGKGEP
jgi:hypothetical protein